MTDTATEDIIQPMARAVTTKIETTRHAAQPDEQTIRLGDRPAQPMPRAALIRQITQGYAKRRARA